MICACKAIRFHQYSVLCDDVVGCMHYEVVMLFSQCKKMRKNEKCTKFVLCLLSKLL